MFQLILTFATARERSKYAADLLADELDDIGISIPLDVVDQTDIAALMASDVPSPRRTEPLEIPTELEDLINQARTLKEEAEREAAIADRLWGPNSDHAKRLRRERRDMERAMHERVLTDEEMAHRWEIRMMREEEARQAIDAVPCSKCGATVGQFCISSGGHSRGSKSVHAARSIALSEFRYDNATATTK